ncbi:pentapeptide repeat-containing protein [Gordonia terrae]
MLAVLAASIAFFAAHKVYRQTERHFRTTNRQDRYTTIASQLADPNAAVRIAAVYALEALADDWLDSSSVSWLDYVRQRAWTKAKVGKVREGARSAARRQAQVCVSVLCAYLRTPLALPPNSAHTLVERSVKVVDGSNSTEDRHAYQPSDIHVRKAITDVIETHCSRVMRVGGDWSDLVFDFEGADLYDVRFSYCRFGSPLSFMRATFHRGASFGGTVFDYSVHFSGAKFMDGMGNFYNVQFQRKASFGRVRFEYGGWFDEAEFSGEADFEGATFDVMPRFPKAVFKGKADFGRVTFGEEADFTEAKFREAADFERAIFKDSLKANGVEFAKEVPDQFK